MFKIEASVAKRQASHAGKGWLSVRDLRAADELAVVALSAHAGLSRQRPAIAKCAPRYWAKPVCRPGAERDPHAMAKFPLWRISRLNLTEERRTLHAQHHD